MTPNKQFLTPEEVSSIYQDNGRFIRSIIKFHLGNSHDVEDVFQSFFLRLLEKPLPKKEVVNQRPYLYRMITNNIVDDVRRTQAYKKYLSKYSAIPLHKSVCNSCEKIIKEEDANSIFKTMENCLPTHIATTLRLRYKDNYSNDQIAATISSKKETITKYISDGLKKLREKLKKSEH